jgi:cytochrome c-type biogenesis protein CcmH
MLVQTGRPDQGFRIWDGLLRRGPADAPWIEPIWGQIKPVVDLAGVDYTIPDIGDSARPVQGRYSGSPRHDPAKRMEMIGSNFSRAGVPLMQLSGLV